MLLPSLWGRKRLREQGLLAHGGTQLGSATPFGLVLPFALTLQDKAVSLSSALAVEAGASFSHAQSSGCIPGL